jgi:hypothetical protein
MTPPAYTTGMDRRLLLRATPLVALCGCIGGGGGGGGDDDENADSPRVTGRTFDDGGECSDPETATVDLSGSDVRIEGCVTGPNGCAVASLVSAAVEDGTLTVVVGTERDAPDDVACTEALVYRAYAATVTLDGAVGSVRVVHDAPGGRTTVTEASA